MAENAFRRLLRLLQRLKKAGMHYELAHYRADAISVTVAVPGERWEIEIFEDAHFEIERFTNPYEGEIRGENELSKLLRCFTAKKSASKSHNR
jgi:hypothetical protein